MVRLAGCAPRSRIQWYVAGVVAVSLAFTAPDTFAFSIEDAVQLAIRTHPTVQAARELRRAADEGVNQARAGYFPTLNARAAHGWARTNNSTTRARSNRQATESQSRNLWRSEPGFPRWMTNLMTCFADSAIRINAIPSALRANPRSPGG